MFIENLRKRHPQKNRREERERLKRGGFHPIPSKKGTGKPLSSKERQGGKSNRVGGVP